MHEFYSEHYITDKKEPAGGTASSIGMTIAWQRGPIQFDDNGRYLPNGADLYDVVSVVVDRLKFLQTTKYNNDNVKKAKKSLTRALEYIQHIPRV